MQHKLALPLCALLLSAMLHHGLLCAAVRVRLHGVLGSSHLESLTHMLLTVLKDMVMLSSVPFSADGEFMCLA